MRKFILFAVLMCTALASRAGLIESTLLDHVTLNTMFQDEETKLSLMDAVVRIGNYKGKSIVDLQLGFDSDVAPEPGEPSGASFLAGGYFKLSSLVNAKLNLPEHWEFLRAVEYGTSYNHNFRDKEWEWTILQLGLAFDPAPKQ